MWEYPSIACIAFFDFYIFLQKSVKNASSNTVSLFK